MGIRAREAAKSRYRSLAASQLGTNCLLPIPLRLFLHLRHPIDDDVDLRSGRVFQFCDDRKPLPVFRHDITIDLFFPGSES